jgi:hypothetical protein
MGAQEDAALVRLGYQALSAGDMDTLRNCLRSTPYGIPAVAAACPGTNRAGTRSWLISGNLLRGPMDRSRSLWKTLPQGTDPERWESHSRHRLLV